MCLQFSVLNGLGFRELSKLVISRVLIRVTPFRALITLLIAYLITKSPAPSSRGFTWLRV